MIRAAVDARTGDWVRVDPKAGRVEVWPRSPEG